MAADGSANPTRLTYASTPDTAAKAPVTANGKGMVVQVGAFSTVENARQLVARMRSAGISGYTEPVKTASGTKIRVRAGPFPSVQAAEKARERLRSQKLASGDLKVVPAGQ